MFSVIGKWLRGVGKKVFARPQGAPPTFFVVGYFGFDLVGDEAILTAMLADLRSACPGARFIVTSQTPANTAATYAVEAIAFEDVTALLAAVKSCDAVLVGGGGVFNEYAPYRSKGFLTGQQDFNAFCADMPMVAWLHGKPCMIFAVGVEPLISADAKEHVCSAFEVASVATVRDRGSHDVVLSAGLKNKQVRVTADPAVRLPPDLSSNAEKILGSQLSEARTGNLRLGVSLRHWNIEQGNLEEKENAWEAQVAVALDRFLSQTSGVAIFIPFQKQSAWGEYGDDTRIFKRVLEKMEERSRVVLIGRQLSCGEVAALLAFCDVNLCMRFHSAVLSIRSAVPCVSLGYSLKVNTVMRRAGLDALRVPLENLTAEQLSAALSACWQKRDKLRRHLRKVAKDWQKRAHENIRIAAQLVKNGTAAVLAEDPLRKACARIVLGQIVPARHVAVSASGVRTAARTLIDDLNRFDVAAHILEIARDPANPDPELTYLLAFCLHRLNRDPDRVIELYTSSLSLGFDEFWVRYNRGSLFSSMGRLRDAQDDLLKALTLRPDHTEARQVLDQIETRIAETG